jgi:hydroxyacyl-ACP dehydratase HTD2-like protein with hotdog domain
MDLLGNQIRIDPFSPFPSIDSFEYRNLAPLYANEPLRLCGRQIERNKYELWAETPEGGVACKGIARTTLEPGDVTAREDARAKL